MLERVVGSANFGPFFCLDPWSFDPDYPAEINNPVVQLPKNYLCMDWWKIGRHKMM